MSKSTGTGSTYVLGHSSDELHRLTEQGRFFGDLTAELLIAAGIRAGMHVLDAGCGAGDVSLLAARLVGPTGRVIAVDKSPEALDLARRRAAEADLANVTFIEHDLSDFALDESVDAVIGRLVLMYFSDPAALLRRLASFLRGGGIIAFHEFDVHAATSHPRCELFEMTLRRVCLLYERTGVDARTGMKLPRIFRDAGLPAPRLVLHGRAEYGADSQAYEQLAGITRTLLPLMEVTGVAREEVVGIDTLAARMREEAVARSATLVSPLFIGAWAQKPG